MVCLALPSQQQQGDCLGRLQHLPLLLVPNSLQALLGAHPSQVLPLGSSPLVAALAPRMVLADSQLSQSTQEKQNLDESNMSSVSQTAAVFHCPRLCGALLGVLSFLRVFMDAILLTFAERLLLFNTFSTRCATAYTVVTIK